MCIIHKWTKWEQYDRQVTMTFGILAPAEIRGKSRQVVEERQRRRCEKCGKVQDLHVRDDE